jgi:hypothetical protein
VPSSNDELKLRALGELCVCLLLVGLLLYNPFLALVAHSDGLTYQALARHRATIGASELQHIAQVQEQSAQPDVIVAEIFTGQVEIKEFPAKALQQPTLLPQMEQIAKIWFRPPPQQ